ncbi:MAG: adenylate/guanylate cyclase domain-containing protein, partial [Alphaproteobacteria bacterium]|nr:adenylate/guanylate cyclase domain-containing protein [Alphaproteobacteria bacterium]
MSAEEGQRKLAAIVAADAAGYSRLMAEDDRATVAAVKEAREVFRERIEAHGGRLVDTAGDSVLAEFRSDVEAVQCAVEVQEKLAEINEPVPEDRRMLFRIGVNTGDVIEEADGTLYGDGVNVNVAARLEGLAEPGSINISARVHDDVEGKVDVGFVDIGEHEVKNIARPVRAYRVVAAGAPEVTVKSYSSRKRLGLIAAFLAGVVVLAGVLWWQARDPESSLMVTVDGAPTESPALAMPTGPAIAVLPFDNFGGDSDQDYFADGLTEDIITALSHFQGIRVIARNSTFKYRGTAVDVREVAADLGADYVLEGSVRRTSENIRVTVQLLDAVDGSHIWAEKYDRILDAAQLFAAQDEITDHVSSAIAGDAGVIVGRELGEVFRKAPESLFVYDCIVLAQ